MAVSAACLFGALGCAGMEQEAVSAPSDPAALAAAASPILPCSSSASAAPLPPTSASAVASSAAPHPVGSAAPSASAAALVPPAAPAFDASKPLHLLQGVVTGPTGKPAANAVVYAPDAPVVAGRGDSHYLDQHNMTFIPYVSAIAVGGKVTFANSDPFPHNVYSTDNEKFNFGMISAHGQRVHVFKQPGAYRLLCNLHPNMLAYVFVSPSSYFAVTNGQGKYVIKDVPEGAHKISVWAAGASAEPQTATVGGADTTLDITLHK